MKKLVFTILTIAFTMGLLNAQSTAMQISGEDCYGNPMDIFADLDAGKAVILHFFMPDCMMCPPPADKIQTMADNIMETYPDMIKGYAFPFQNSTSCDYSASWVEDNHLPFYAPMDSGATPVAYYGGFGMPTVVLLGGSDHRVMFSTQSFSTSDTSEMADSILALFGETSTLIGSAELIQNISVSPNPANDFISVNFSANTGDNVQITVFDLAGNVITSFNENNSETSFSKSIETASLAEGVYILKMSLNGNIRSGKFTVIH